MRFIETYIPWTAEWLWYYEYWRSTGKWVGGGAHPSRSKKVANVLQNNEIDLHDAIYQHSDRSSFRLIGSIPAWKQQTKARGARRGGFGGEGEEGAPGGE
ncbi:hypothetical protein [Burkholderia pseudomallei]|uniref:hypothetical protein n=1 Tax=Burkholderia pseudomallei TaxID=28450 RepID=UPI0015C3A35B|nr:hypothetical protein [Burkholderia pseudomallei]